jgi:hypothetical protein
MLKHRLIFGVLMTVFFGGIVVLDGIWDGSATATPADDKAVQGTLLAVIVAGVLSLATVEFARLAAAKGLAVSIPVCAVGVALLSTAWYWPQFLGVPAHLYLLTVTVLCLLGVLLEQYVRRGVDGTLGNGGASCLAVVYLGFLGAFVLAIRIDAGLWEILMVMFVVKVSDIGAYTFGKLFGRHKFSPRQDLGGAGRGDGGRHGGQSRVCRLFRYNGLVAGLGFWRLLRRDWPDG